MPGAAPDLTCPFDLFALLSHFHQEFADLVGGGGHVVGELAAVVVVGGLAFAEETLGARFFGDQGGGADVVDLYLAGEVGGQFTFGQEGQDEGGADRELTGIELGPGRFLEDAALGGDEGFVGPGSPGQAKAPGAAFADLDVGAVAAGGGVAASSAAFSSSSFFFCSSR